MANWPWGCRVSPALRPAEAGRALHLGLATSPLCGAAGWSRVEQQKEHGGGGGGRVAHHLSRAGSVVLQQAGGLRRGSVELRGGGASGVRSLVCQYVPASALPDTSGRWC